jgi:hypothetical protein
LPENKCVVPDVHRSPLRWLEPRKGAFNGLHNTDPLSNSLCSPGFRKLRPRCFRTFRAWWVN